MKNIFWRLFEKYCSFVTRDPYLLFPVEENNASPIIQLGKEQTDWSLPEQGNGFARRYCSLTKTNLDSRGFLEKKHKRCENERRWIGII